jgi:flagellar biosynthesis/type III secretory pathway M-ring protein FliF/YscJ
MIIALVASEIWTALLVVGIIASFITVMLIVGTGSANRQASSRPELLPGSPARTIRDRASVRAAEAVRRRSNHALTNVRVVAPAGQTASDTNDLHLSSEARAEAAAILAHFAEHDPKRIAEVITQWIQVDNNIARKLEP